MKKQEIAISVNDLHVYYRDMKRFSLKKGFKDKGSGKIFKAVKGVTFVVLIYMVIQYHYYQLV